MGISRNFRPAAMLAFVCATIAPFCAHATSDKDATGHIHFLVQQAAERGLVLGKGNVAAGIEFAQSSAKEDSYFFRVPLRIGLRDRVDFFASLQRSTVFPATSLPDVGVTYRAVDGLLEIAGRGSLELAVFDDPKAAAVHLSVPMRLHFRENLSMDATPRVSIMVSPDSSWYLNIPLAGNYNLTDEISITAGPTFSLQDGLAGASGLVLGASWTAATDGKPWLEVGGRLALITQNKVATMQMILAATYYGHGLGR